MTGTTIIASFLRNAFQRMWAGACRAVVSMLCLLMTAVSTISCSSHDDGEEETHAAPRYIKLCLNANGTSVSRSDEDPTGGEDGDGREAGILNENKIYNVSLFLFDGSSTSDNIKRSDPVLYSFYFDDLKLNGSIWEQTIEFPNPPNFHATPESFYAIVIANAGDMTSLFANYGDLLDYHFETLYKQTSGAAVTPTTPITNYDRFIMTSAEISSKLTFGADPDGSFAHPYTTGTINVQRLTARLDINPNTDMCQWKEIDKLSEFNDCESYKNNPKSGYLYTVMKQDPEDASSFITTNDRFLLTDLYLTNAHTGGTWLAKRVAPSLTSSEVTFFGKETSETGAATNWVQSYNPTGVTWTTKSMLMQSPMAGWSYFIAGYMEENTHQTNITTLNIKGYYKKQKKDGSGNYIDDYSYEEKEYQYRIRHSDPSGNGTASDPMHYAIVRNNIYRIKIDKIVKSDLEHAAVVLYYLDSSGKYVYQDIGIDKDITDDTGGSDPQDPNDAPRRKTSPQNR